MNKIEQSSLEVTRSWWTKPILASMLFIVFVNCITVYNYNSTESDVIASNDDITNILDEYALQEVDASLYNF